MSGRSAERPGKSADGGRPTAKAEATESETAEAVPGESEAGREVADDLDALLDDVKRERDEYLALAQRAKADFENYRKRAARDGAAAERRGRASLARALLPSIDNLERALQASGFSSADDRPAADAVSEEVSGHEALARGVALIHSELQEALARAGVEAYDPTGERFDPAWHEAISTREASETEETGAVVETLDRGYRVDGEVLRPARVVVGE